jgi:hypothetical protein
VQIVRTKNHLLFPFKIPSPPRYVFCEPLSKIINTTLKWVLFCAQSNIYSSSNFYNLERHVISLQKQQVMSPCTLCPSVKTYHRVQKILLFYLCHHEAQVVLIRQHVFSRASDQSAKMVCITSHRCACLPFLSTCQLWICDSNRRLLPNHSMSALRTLHI